MHKILYLGEESENIYICEMNKKKNWSTKLHDKIKKRETNKNKKTTTKTKRELRSQER